MPKYKSRKLAGTHTEVFQGTVTPLFVNRKITARKSQERRVKSSDHVLKSCTWVCPYTLLPDSSSIQALP
jgi:hypothetical protein